MPNQRYKEAQERVKAATEEARRLAQEAFTEVSRVLLAELGIESFSWAQYTPHFNDGDECIFGVRADPDSVAVNGVVMDDTPGYDWRKFTTLPEGTFKTYGEALEAKKKAYPAYYVVADFINGFDAADLKHMFGDHVKVVVTKEGSTTEEYGHD